MTTLIEDIKRRAEQQQVLSQCSIEEITEAEAILGFHLPPFLKELYLTIGDGGYGPSANGIVSLESLVSGYEPYFDPINNEYYPEGILELCEYGCSYVSVLDCLAPGFPVYCYNEDRIDSENPACLYQGHSTIEGFFRNWIEGADEMMFFFDWIPLNDPTLDCPSFTSDKALSDRLHAPLRRPTAEQNGVDQAATHLQL